MREKIYQQPWFIWLMIIVFFPLGLIFLWASDKYSKKIKLIVTGIFICLSAFSFLNTPPENTEDVQKPQTAAAEIPSAQGTDNQEPEKINHSPDAERVLQKLYDAEALKFGSDIPAKAGVSVTSYRQRESAPGFTESEGTFALSSKKGVTHQFVILWGKNSYDIIKVVIDGKQVLYDEDLRIKYMGKYEKK